MEFPVIDSKGAITFEADVTKQSYGENAVIKATNGYGSSIDTISYTTSQTPILHFKTYDCTHGCVGGVSIFRPASTLGNSEWILSSAIADIDSTGKYKYHWIIGTPVNCYRCFNQCHDGCYNEVVQ